MTEQEVKGKSRNDPTRWRIPHVTGWVVESNVCRILAEVCEENAEAGKRAICPIKSADHWYIDGGILIDPPEDFPFHDLSKTARWLEQQDPRTTIKVIPFDVKTSLSRANHNVPVYFVTLPVFPEYTCIVPARSYHSLVAVWNRWLEGKTSRTFPDILAIFAVYRRDLYQALLNLVHASVNQVPYVNPSNGRIFHGWRVPGSECTIGSLLRIKSEQQLLSRNTTQLLAAFLENKLSQLHFLQCPLQPLVSDHVILDASSTRHYFLEHKSLSDGTVSREWFNPKLNYHFLIHQIDKKITMWTRPEVDFDYKTKSVYSISHINIDLDDPSAPATLLKFVNAHGSAAKAALQKKWKLFDLYDERTFKIESHGKETQQPKIRSSHTFRTPTEIMEYTTSYAELLNDQCYKRGQHCCVVLNGHPSADAIFVEHVSWTQEELNAYKSTRVLPVSLVRKAGDPDVRCIPIRSIPHVQFARIPSAQQFEPGQQQSFRIPPCAGLDWIYVVAAGGIAYPESETAPLRKAIVLPSEETNWFATSECQTCDNTDQPRQWTHVAKWEQKGKDGRGSSLLETAFLLQGTNLSFTMLNFEDGSIHDYFCRMLSGDGSVNLPSDPSRYITTVFGSGGILQRGWNHGALRLKESYESPEDNLMQRVLTTIPEDIMISPASYLQSAIDEQKSNEKESNPHFKSLTLTRHAHRELINNTEWGITMKDHVARFGFESDGGLHCDNCEDEEDCKIYAPEFANALCMSKVKCGGCIGSDKPCSFDKLDLELEVRLRSFDAFRRSVPCHFCWRNGLLCDNGSGTCHNCTATDETCERQMCEYYEEPGDDSSCKKNCDQAHFDDGYEHIADTERGPGFNVLQALPEVASDNETKVAVCRRCWARGWDAFCDNGSPCVLCSIAQESDPTELCQRQQCRYYGKCAKADCNLAHFNQALPRSDLFSIDPSTPRRHRDDLKVLEARYPLNFLGDEDRAEIERRRQERAMDRASFSNGWVRETDAS